MYVVKLTRMFGDEELPVVEQVVPGLKEAREDVELEYGNVSRLGELYGLAERVRLARAADLVHAVELELELAPVDNGALVEVGAPELVGVLLGDAIELALVEAVGGGEQRAHLGQYVREGERVLDEAVALVARLVAHALAARRLEQVD